MSDRTDNILERIAAALEARVVAPTQDTADLVDLLREEVASLKAQKNGAYSERNKVVAAYARLCHAAGTRVTVAKHQPGPDSAEIWEPEWSTVVLIELPTGQVSWHFHDSELHLLDGLPRGANDWDGHSTAEKYTRLNNARPVASASVVQWPTPQPIETAPLSPLMAWDPSGDVSEGFGPAWVHELPNPGMTVEEWRALLKMWGRTKWLPMPPPGGGK